MTIGDVLSEEEMNVFYNQIIGDRAFNQETLLNVLLGYKWEFWVAIKFMQGENGKKTSKFKRTLSKLLVVQKLLDLYDGLMNKLIDCLSNW